ncbi:hypothetical protein [Scytonema sp. UIC 10036]|uniref:hypothetical protein n=1 Tax=Scytonema sp. UIC 10036 TaxID=2304196 RepID=UPI001FA956E0|nr:hypothetical protein [Scytonema sp. UIC 10036]
MAKLDFADSNTITFSEKDEKKETQIYQALLSLNYHQQVQKFENFWRSSRIGSFVVHGKGGRCQRWLVNRLIHKESEYFPDASRAKKISIVLPEEGEIFISELWLKLSTVLGLKYEASPEELAKKIFEEWRTSTVIMVFYNLNVMYKNEPKKLIDYFWHPLIKMVENCEKNDEYNYLLMILVDNAGDAYNWEIAYCRNLEEWENRIPFDLQEIQTLSLIDIKRWMEIKRRQLHFPEDNMQLARLAENWWRQSDRGIPELVVNQICKYCKSSWPKIEKLLDY